MADPGRIAGPVVIPQCVEVNLRWTFPNSKVVRNVLHGRAAGGFSATATVAEAIRAAIVASGAWTAIKADLNSGTSLTAVELRDIRNPNFPIVESTGGPNAGTGGGDALPSEVALVCTLRTAAAGPGFRGRVYVGGYDAGTLAATGVATAGVDTRLAAFITEVQTAMAASGLTLCIAQPARAEYTGKTGALHPARVATTQDVTSIVVRDLVFDSQRRRKQ